MAARSGSRTRSWCTAAGVAVAVLLLVASSSPPGRRPEPATPRDPDVSLVALRRHAVDVLAADGSTPPTWDAWVEAPDGVSVDAVAGTPASNRLTLRFIGANGPATEPCGADYTATAVESATAVALVVVEDRGGVPSSPRSEYGDDLVEICTLAGFPRSGTVTLTRPLGHRAVLDTQSGARLRVWPAFPTRVPLSR
ncbi:hypothetical protein [Actinoplanes sp. NPDC089786]|uniref:hypothetical protein n=1 Tax=Actinoplanes sp. NPDC089786 TaxID=3155185 RepID=UPI00343A9334